MLLWPAQKIPERRREKGPVPRGRHGMPLEHRAAICSYHVRRGRRVLNLCIEGFRFGPKKQL